MPGQVCAHACMQRPGTLDVLLCRSVTESGPSLAASNPPIFVAMLRQQAHVMTVIFMLESGPWSCIASALIH